MHLGLGEKLAEGYAEIDWDKDGRIAGRICAYRASGDGDRNVRAELGTVGLEGRNPRTGTAEIRLRLDARAGDSILKDIIPDREIKIGQTGYAGRNFKYSVMAESWGNWGESIDKGGHTSPNDFSIEFNLIPKSLAPKNSERFTTIGVQRRSGKYISRRFDLAKFDKLTPAQALALRSKLTFEDDVAPGAVIVKYPPAVRANIVKYLERLGGLAKLVDTPIPNCGAPHVTDIVDVPPLLEFYFARKLQISGLFLSAYPEIYPKSPPFEPISTRAGPVREIFNNASLDLEQKTERLASFLEKEVIAFLDARRPKHKGRWEITPRKSGLSLGYRAVIVGAMISACQATGWEKIDVQFVSTGLATGGKLSLAVQVVEGYEAPNALDQRPPDDRFKDNRLKDDRLARIQELMVSFLLSRGFKGDGPGDDASKRNDPCLL